MIGKCAKQTTVAIIDCGDEVFIGSNWCEHPQDVCPRKNMQTGVGYDLCKSICGQKYHAEVDAIKKAGKKARGRNLVLFGHYYCCEDCKNEIEKAGIKNVIIVDNKG